MTEKRIDVVVDSTGAKVGAQQYNAATRSMRTNSVATGRAVDNVGTRANKLGQTLRTVGKIAAGALAFGGVSAGIRSVTDTIAKFEETMALTGAIAGVEQTSEAYKTLNQTARELGATTRFSANEAGQGLLFLSRAGFDARESTAALSDTLNLAAAGSLELGSAADIASNIGSTFAKEYGGAVNATSVAVDTLTATANKSNTSVQQLAEAMKFAGPTAASFGVEMNEASAAIGQLGNFGIQGSLAGTNLRGVLSSLVDVTGKGETALDSLGLTLEDISPETNTLADIFRNLRDAGLGAEEALALFGRRNAGAALIFSQTADEIDNLKTQLNGAEGEAARIADTMNDTLRGAFLSLRSAIQEAMLQIGDAGFGGALRSIVDTTTNVIRVFVGMEDSIKSNKEQAKQLANILRSVAAGAGAIVAINLAKWFGTALIALRAFTAAALTNPFGALAAGVGLAVGAIIHFRDTTINAFGESFKVIDVAIATWEHFKDKVAFILKAIAELSVFVWKEIKDAFKSAFDTIVENLNKFFGPFMGIINTLWDNIKIVVENGVAFTRASIVALIKSLREIIGNFVSEFANIGSSFITLIDPNAAFVDKARAFAQIPASFGRAAKDSAEKFKSEFNQALRSGEGIFEAFKGEVTGTLDDMQTFFDNNGIDLNAEDFERFLTPWGQAEDIARRVRDLAEERRKILMDQKNTIAETNKLLLAMPGFGGGISSVISINDPSIAKIEGIKDELSELDKLKKRLNEEPLDVTGGAQNRGALIAFPGFGGGGIAGVARIAETAQDSISSVDSATRTLESTFSRAFQSIISGTQSVVDGIKSIGQSILELVLKKALLDPLADSFTNLLTGNGGLLSGLFSSASGSASAKGNVFRHGETVPFASGGLISDTAIFPMRGNKVGIAGEAGTEYAAKVRRDSQGNTVLDVADSSGGSVVNVGGITIVANNPQEFRQSTREITRSVRKSMERANGG